MQKPQTTRIIAQSISDFFDQYTDLIKKGWTYPHRGIFEMQVEEGVSVNFWNIDMVFDVQSYLSTGIDSLPWEDLKALARGVEARIESKEVTINNIKKALGLTANPAQTEEPKTVFSQANEETKGNHKVAEQLANKTTAHQGPSKPGRGKKKRTGRL